MATYEIKATITADSEDEAKGIAESVGMDVSEVNIIEEVNEDDIDEDEA